MEKMKFETPDMTAENIDKIAALFPNCITESSDGRGGIRRAVNFDMLRQMLSKEVVEGDEAYEFTWVGKKAAVVEANKPIRKTLRPCPEESVDWDNTENLYIEGDNLEVLKLLQESYLGKVKMIYIDPPYNTGHDFVYPDSFMMDNEEYNEGTGYFDEEGNVNYHRENSASAGKYHSDWCSMIYSRLMLARNLLTDDGVIFISIDDNEQDNLKKICDEVFGSKNAIGPIIQNKLNAKNDTVDIQKNHEFILVYRKTMRSDNGKVLPTVMNKTISYRDVFEDNGEYYYLNDSITTRGEGGTLVARPNLGYTVYYNPDTKDKIAVHDYDIKLIGTTEDIYTDDTELISKGYVPIRPPRVRNQLGVWTWSLEKFNDDKKYIVITGKKGSYSVKKRTFVDKNKIVEINEKKQYVSETIGNSKSIIEFSTNDGSIALSNIMNTVFNNPKNIQMLKYLIGLINDNNFTILDFFSGSATTAHAVMQLNAEEMAKITIGGGAAA